MTLPSILLDVICVVLLIGCTILYARKGFLSALVSLVGTIAALIASSIAASRFAPWIFNQYFRPGLEEKATEAIAAQGALDLEALLDQFVGFLPETTLKEIAENFANSTDLRAPTLAAELVEQVVKPMVVPVITVFLFVIVFLLLRLLVGLISRILTGANHIPLIGTANGALGAVMGVLLGALYILVLITVAGAVSSFWVSQAEKTAFFANSFVWRLFSGFRFIT